MYIVAINIDHWYRIYSLTCRDLKRSPHWATQSGDIAQTDVVWTIRDTRESEVKLFTVLFRSASETEARKFATVVEAGYELAGYVRAPVKVVDGLAV
jgi:hypothetical protein